MRALTSGQDDVREVASIGTCPWAPFPCQHTPT